MRALVLNLAGAVERMAFQRGQLERLGIAIERVEAVTPETLQPPADDPYWDRWERPMRDAEKAILGSHRAAWARVAAMGAPALVLEDDAWLGDGVPGLLAELEVLAGIDHVTLETRGRRKLLGRRHRDCRGIVRLWQDRTGAAAYVLWPAGARKLLARSAARPGLADAVICAAYELSSWQAVPALAIQMDQAAHYGLEPPMQTQSSVLPHVRPKGGLAFRLRRIMAQVRMGLRALAHPLAKRVFLSPETLQSSPSRSSPSAP